MIVDICKSVVGRVSQGVASVIIDLEKRTVLGIYNTLDPSLLDDRAVAGIIDLFRGLHIGRLEQIFCQFLQVGEKNEPVSREIHLISGEFSYFGRAFQNGKAAIVLMTKKTANIGMAWAHLKLAIPLIEEELFPPEKQ
ncbi:MAG: hypothetical protein WAO55_04865 [Candidatus Manganitrophaceae bacterium]